MREPVVAWRIESDHYTKPIIPGLAVTDRWAVVTPDGYVITDEYTAVGHKFPLTVAAWVKSEIEWVNDPGNDWDFWTASQTMFSTRGPVPRALWLMTRDPRIWSGTARELLKALLPFRDTFEPDWPRGPAALLSTLKSLSADMAAVGLYIDFTNAWQLSIRRSEGDVVEIAELTPER